MALGEETQRWILAANARITPSFLRLNKKPFRLATTDSWRSEVTLQFEER